MRIGEATPVAITDLWGRVESRVRSAGNLAEAAQELAKELHLCFEASVALARVFFTVPYGSLPEDRQEFVRALARPSGAVVDLNSTTQVLSLVGTHGDQKDWNDPGKSRDHLGIPLISAQFVGGIPMISRLLRELKVPLDWIDTHDAAVIQKTLGESSSLFFVDDAGVATDDDGRKIIAARDFVADYKIQSVFGIGGAYSGGEMLVTVVFNHDRFERENAEQFLPLATLFKSNTERLVAQRRIFAED
ncbi:MAG: hypothetical protein JRH01_23600 [Deltaproteobacteria bacterium]|nr:hypothetical protein [Deltaproteobacteria bacterium]